ncbi:MAG: sulfatase-like hydrolase/transferase, partial [Planctomycetota bacterium]
LSIAQAAFHYALIAAVLGAPLALLATAERRVRGRAWPGTSPGARKAVARTLGLWLAVGLYWWTRPVVFPGLSATDPKRLAAAAAILVLGILLGALVARLALGSARTRARILSSIAVAAVVIGAVVTVASLRGRGERGRIGESNEGLPNILLVIVDALRQDTIRAYGDDEVHTPHIDRLAGEGVLFEDAYVQVPFTWPSFGSFLTGKVPRRHGLIRMEPGVRFPVNATLPVLLKSGVREDGRRLGENDWIAGALMTGTISHGSRLLEGFDAYLEALVGHELVDVHDPWSEFRSGLLPWLVLNKLGQRTDRHLVTTTAESWLRSNDDRRFLAMVHLYSTHTPYDPAPEFRARHLDPDYDGPFDSFVAAHRKAIEDGDYVPTVADMLRIRRLYLAGVEEADAMLGRLIATLEESGVLDDTIVVFTSDHGESLGEHGLWEHNWMYEDNLRIPLILRYPPGLPAGVRVPGLVDSIDLLPTLFDLAGIVPPESAVDVEPELIGQDGELDLRSRRLWHAIDGSSLLPLVRGEVESVRDLAFAENGLFTSVRDERWKLIVRRELLRGSAWDDLLRDPRSAEAPRLFDLQEDPLELENLFDRSDEARAVAGRLFEEMRKQSARLPIRESQIERSGRDLRAEQIFRGLGYGGGVGAGDEPSDGE